tara:strand:+ start:50 stop:646 length:597 start_codon:yes stop_codon:yes gene_type:complete
LEGLFSTISNAGNWIKDTLGEGYDMIMGSEDTMLPDEEKDNKQQNFSFEKSSGGGSNSIDGINQNDINFAVSDKKQGHSLLDASKNNFNVPGGPSKYTGYNQVQKTMDDKFEEDWQDEMDAEWETQHAAENVGRYGTDNLADVATLNLQKYNKEQDAQKRKTGEVLSAFSDAFGKMRSDLRDPYLYDSASIFGKGINS